MSLASARAMLAAAASSVPDVTGHAYPPRVITTGDAWPVWVQTRPLNYCVADADFDLYVAVGSRADLAATIDAADAQVVTLIGALLSFGAEVQYVEPAAARAQDGATEIPCLRIRCVVGAELST